jgi:RNA polymerase sigma factor (sigma-70 family)
LDTQEQFCKLMQEARAGSQEAARQLLETYGDPIRRVVRRRLDQRLRRRFDSGDFFQSVWLAFFEGLSAKDWSFDRPEDLQAFLQEMARRKVANANRRLTELQQENVTREQSLDGSAAALAMDLVDGGPSPSQAAIAQDQWDLLRARTRRPGKKILEMLRTGSTHQEIAQQLGVTEKEIQRILRRLFTEMNQ